MTVHARTRTIAVIGSGIVAVAAAIAFRRALPHAEVTVYAGRASAPEYPGAAAPFIHRFHDLIGLEREAFRRRTGGVTVPEAEIRRACRAPFRLVPLAEMPHVEGAALHQLWLRLSLEHAGAPAWSEIATRARRQEDRVEGLGVRFDPKAYLILLSELAAHRGARIVREAASSAELAATHDLVVDATEPELPGAEWLRIEGVPANCLWSLNPGARTAGEAIETVELAADHAVWNNLAWQAETRVEAKAAAGRIVAPWRGNVLAVGRAAVQCETFDGQPLAVALAGIVRALELLPRPGASGREAAEYNRRSGAVHDFLLDWAAERWGVDRPPSGLSALRGQFEHRGRIPFRDEDPVPAGQWIGWLLGSGVSPRHVDLTAMALPEARLAAIFA